MACPFGETHCPAKLASLAAANRREGAAGSAVAQRTAAARGLEGGAGCYEMRELTSPMALIELSCLVCQRLPAMPRHGIEITWLPSF